MIDVTQKTRLRKVMQVNNQGQNNDISTFLNEKHFCRGCDWFSLCYQRRRKSNGTIFRKVAAVIEISCSEPPFDGFFFSFGFTNYDTFAEVLIILNGLLFF